MSSPHYDMHCIHANIITYCLRFAGKKRDHSEVGTGLTAIKMVPGTNMDSLTLELLKTVLFQLFVLFQCIIRVL